MAEGAPDAGQGIALLGGTFNPLHVGHLRLAIEVHEAFAGIVSRVDILPNSRPPHKANAVILPFAIRAALIREACAPYPWLFCNELEGEREDQSYTWDTLGIFAEREPGRRFYFVLGSGDFEMLPSWKNGLRLPERCTPVVVPKAGNAFTMQVLYRLGFRWNPTPATYVEQFLDALEGMGYFDWEE